MASRVLWRRPAAMFAPGEAEGVGDGAAPGGDGVGAAPVRDWGAPSANVPFYGHDVVRVPVNGLQIDDSPPWSRLVEGCLLLWPSRVRGQPFTSISFGMVARAGPRPWAVPPAVCPRLRSPGPE